ncbi:MAG: hypothetical protein MUC38_01290 [Cyclobacteriaceae bacterium]|jgi:hypothetical protein|nr:hypothetical protein [Cyclobacteriaceae bacterium]
MRIPKILFFGAVLTGCWLATPAVAQYTTSVGARVGGTSGVTLKHFYKPSLAFEGIVGGFANGMSLTGLVQKTLPAFDTPGLSWYYGGGAHLAFYNDERLYYNRFGRELGDRRNTAAGVGINGILGLEYRLSDNLPLSFSMDVKPFVEFGPEGYAGFALDPSLAIRFILR